MPQFPLLRSEAGTGGAAGAAGLPPAGSTAALLLPCWHPALARGLGKTLPPHPALQIQNADFYY